MMLILGLEVFWFDVSLNLQMASLRDISVCSFNCRGFKNSLHTIHELCNNHDIVLLQEHWLLPCDLALLNTVHSDFLSTGLSAVDISSNILVGRP